MKKILSFLLLVFILASCTSPQEIVQNNEKADFNIETISGDATSGVIFLEKTGQVRSSQDISLSANASGRVRSVLVKPGDSVFAGQVLANLEDNILSYGINLQRSSNDVERAQINYESSELSLSKDIFDAQLNLERLEKNLLALRSEGEQSILLARDALEDSNDQDLGSSFALRLERIDNSITKAKLDYDIRVSSDQQTLEGYKSNLKKEFSGVLTILIDVQEFADNLLGVTPNNRTEDDDIENFFGVQNLVQKTESKRTLEDLIDFRESESFSHIANIVRKDDISESEMVEVADFIDDGYDIALDLLNSLEITLNNSVRSEGTFGQAEIDALTSSMNNQQSQAQNAYGAYISLGTTIKNFISTYRANQASILQSIQLQENDRDIEYRSQSSGEISASTGFETTVITVNDRITDLESQVDNARETLENAIKNKDITLRSLENAISEAQIGYSSSAKELGKLTLVSPINGTIGEVFIDKGQEIFSGTIAFDIVSSSTPEVEVSFSQAERDLLSANSKVEILLGTQVLEGSIYSVSQVADINLNYKATVVFDTSVSLIGNLVTVKVPVVTGKMLLPINIIEVKGDDIGLVKTLSGSTFADVRVRLGDVFGEYIEIVSCAKNCSDLQIISSDISNFDENKFTIVEK